jgi:hypothetical protein
MSLSTCPPATSWGAGSSGQRCADFADSFRLIWLRGHPRSAALARPAAELGTLPLR